jgi:hypothetical protein
MIETCTHIYVMTVHVRSDEDNRHIYASASSQSIATSVVELSIVSSVDPLLAPTCEIYI